MDIKNEYKVIEDNGIKVLYSEGFKAKAEEQLNRVSNMKKFYNEKVGFKDDIDVFILNKTDYEVEFEEGPPYGMPFTIPREYTKGNSIIVSPATDDGVVTEVALKYVDKLPEEAKILFEEAGCSNEEGIKKHTHLIILHEFGHNVVNHLKLDRLGKWFNETLTNFCTIEYLKKNEPENAKLWLGNLYLTYLDGGKPEYTDLRSFEELYSSVKTENYVWYQNQFTFTCEEVYKELKDCFLMMVEELLGGKVIEDPEVLLKEMNTITNVFSHRWSKIK